MRGSVTVLGRSIPLPVAWLAGLIVGTSVAGALSSAVLVAGVLVPQRVWAGELWRLVTWVLIERDPVSLLFACLMIVWFGSDIVRAWSAARFTISCAALAVIPAGLTCVLAWALPVDVLMRVPYFSAWPVVEGLTIAWALLFPNRQILLFLVLPVQGRMLLWVTVGLTLLYAIFNGWRLFVPHFFAEGLALVYLGRFGLGRSLWLRFRLALYERELRRRAGSLRVIHKDGDQGRWSH